MRNIDMKYYNTYYYCNIIDNLLYHFVSHIDWASTGAQFTEPFFEGEVRNFPKFSALHEFCIFAINVLISEDAEQAFETIQVRYDELSAEINKANRLRMAFQADSSHADVCLEVDRIIKEYANSNDTFYKFLLDTDFVFLDDAFSDFCFANGDIDAAVTHMGRELFYVLFQNRDFLFRFNYYMAAANPTKINRSAIPQWVKRAVKYRDRGRCVCCRKDLSGLLDCEDEASVHYDHIVSLHDGGLNDVSNIQLMCRDCNLSKSDESLTFTVYNDWYDWDVE